MTYVALGTSRIPSRYMNISSYRKRKKEFMDYRISRFLNGCCLPPVLCFLNVIELAIEMTPHQSTMYRNPKLFPFENVVGLHCGKPAGTGIMIVDTGLKRRRFSEPGHAALL